jgi:putative FmdB family regulatory protein
MPVYTFKCECGNEFKKLLKKKEDTNICQECGKSAEMQLPSTSNSITYEAKDKYQGKQIRKDLDTQLKDRMTQHHDKYELEEKIDKHGMNDAEKHGWLKKVKKL